MKPTLIAPGTKRLKPTYHALLSILLQFAFNFNSRRFIQANQKPSEVDKNECCPKLVKVGRCGLAPVDPGLAPGDRA